VFLGHPVICPVPHKRAEVDKRQEEAEMEIEKMLL